MKKGWKVFLSVFISLSFILIMLILLSNSSNENQNLPLINNSNQIIFYYGDTCPHCHEMIDVIKENNYEDEFNIVYKEVYNNKVNSNELVEVAQNCNLNTNSIGVPFVYYQDKCYIGIPDINSIFTGGVN